MLVPCMQIQGTNRAVHADSYKSTGLSSSAVNMQAYAGVFSACDITQPEREATRATHFFTGWLTNATALQDQDDGVVEAIGTVPHRRSAPTVQSYSPDGTTAQTHLIPGSLGPKESKDRTEYRSLQPFCRARPCVEKTVYTPLDVRPLSTNSSYTINAMRIVMGKI